MNPNLTLFAQAAEFLLFIWITVKYIWPWLLSKIEERQKLIADGLAEAERGRSSLAEAQKEKDAILHEARSRAQELVAQAVRSANQRVEDAKVQAKTEGERLLAGAHAQIQQEVQTAKQQLREQVRLGTASGKTT